MASIEEAMVLLAEALPLYYPLEERRALQRYVFSKVLSLSDTEYYMLDRSAPISEKDFNIVAELARGLSAGIPIQYLLGEAQFLGLRFRVSPDVLIPRPETEELCQRVIDRIRLLSREAPGRVYRVLDIGTGSGCIACSIKHALGDLVDVWAIDKSLAALQVARENVDLVLGDERLCHLQHCDLLGDDIYQLGAFDIIVSNPPYIHPKEQEHMLPSVYEQEPQEALFAPIEDPILFYRRIAEVAEKGLLESGGEIFLEINPIFSQETEALFLALAREEGAVSIYRDLSQKERFIHYHKA